VHLPPDMAQFVVRHVSCAYRRQRIGAALAAKVIKAARHDGAKQLYVSAAPARATVDFHRSLGFQPTRAVTKELFRLEPEDIRMRLSL